MSSPVAAARPPASRWLVLAIVAIAQFMVVLDMTITNVALPSIEADLGLSTTDLQWVVNAYVLLFGGFLLLGGRAADLFGRRRLFLVGVGLFSVASIAAAFSTGAATLIAARGVQGLGAALVGPAALSIVTTTFTGADRARALGVWAAISAGGSAFGLLLGGFLTEALSWEWIFAVNVPVGIAALIAALRWVPESRLTHATGGFDVPGAVLATGGLVALVYAITQAGERGFGDPGVIAMGVGAIALLVAFVLVEQRREAPMVRLDVFRNRSLSTANGAMLFVTGGLFSFFFFGSLFLQQVKGYGPLEAGVAFLPMTAGIVVGSGLSQALVTRFGAKPVLLGGLSLVVAGLGWATTLSPTSGYADGLLPTLLLMSLGMGTVFVGLTLAATAGVESDDQGLASGLFNTSQQIGGAIGLAVLTTVATNVTTGAVGDGAGPATAMVDGFTAAFAVGAGLIAAGLVVVGLFLDGRRVDEHAETAGAELLAV